MNKLYQQLRKRQEKLSIVKERLIEESKRYPQGKLRISKRNNKCQYYHILDAKETNGKYIPRKNVILAKALAQKDYSQKVICEINKELSQIETFLETYIPDRLENTYHNINPYRKNLITPLFITDEEYARNWLKDRDAENTFYIDEKKYQTKQGEYVRSKSELLIANLYYEMGIPYKYEYPLRLSNGKVKYPDFTILDTKNRKEIYHEHMGLLGDENYRKANFNKLMEYSKNGIYSGKNLILTFETAENPIDIHAVKRMLEEVLHMR